MIKIIRASTLAALQARADQVADLSEHAAKLVAAAAEAEHQAQAAAAAVSQAQAALAESDARFTALFNDTIAGLGRLGIAARDPQAGPSVQAGIALHFLRSQITKIKASGDAAAIDGIRPLDALIGSDSPLGQELSQVSAPAGSTGGTQCKPADCPLPYAPGLEIPCVAARRCLRVNRLATTHPLKEAAWNGRN